LKKSIEDCVQSAFDKVEACYIKDAEILGENILNEVLERIFTGFSDGAEMAIVDVCKETYKACNILIQAYVNTIILEVIPQLKKEIIAELENLQVKGDQ